MILLVVVALAFVSPALYLWERNRDAGYDRFELAIVKQARRLSALDEATLLDRVLTHPYFTGPLRDLPPVRELLAQVEGRRYKPLVDDWERVARQLVDAERQLGRSGTPELVRHESELNALLRALETTRRA
jgi:hypothetical protein